MTPDVMEVEINSLKKQVDALFDLNAAANDNLSKLSFDIMQELSAMQRLFLNRVPIWVTAGFTGAGFIIGSLITVVGILFKGGV